MSWLFGFKQPDQIVPPMLGGAQGGSDDSGKPADKIGAETTYRFDSAALERAAKAAKDLERSAYAKEALELARSQEKTKQLELEASIKQFATQEEQLKLEQAKKFAEERKALLEEETRQAQIRSRYQDELARRRHEDQMKQQAALQEDLARKQEESVAKQEALRKRTIEYEAELKHQYDMKHLEAELKGKAKIERENRDIYLEQIRLKASEHRQTVLESIKTSGTVLGNGFQALLNDPGKLLVTLDDRCLLDPKVLICLARCCEGQKAGGVTLLALGIYSAKMAASVGANYLDSHLGKPVLVRDTSRLTLYELIRHPFQVLKRLRAKAEDSLHGVFLEPSLEKRLRELAVTTRNTKRNYGLFRNVLMYGPPGTGKTLFAKKLAKHSGMDYAIMTGGDIAPLGRDGVSGIHKVFDWANTSRKGLLLFLDEADAFLRKRATEKISEDMRAALNAFLFRTGEQSNKFMLVVASNEPEQFDWAVNDRIDEIVNFTLPGIEERKRMIFYYFDKYIISSLQGKRKIKLGDFNFTEICNLIAEKSAGFSGREISKLMVACQAAAFAAEDCTLTKEMIVEKLNQACNAHVKKTIWNTEAQFSNDS